MRLRLSLAVSALFLTAFAFTARASDESRIYLSWHAPWGAPGATVNLNLAPGDTTAEDTLYLSCDPGNDSPTFNGFTATLYFRAAFGDTLGPYWRFGTGMNDLRNIRAIWETDSTTVLHAPWKTGGFGAINYDWSRGSGHLQMIFAVPPQRTGSVKFGERYCFARLLFRRPPRGLARADQPICVEWAVGTLAFAYGYEPEVNRGERFATVNSPDGAVCEAHRRSVAPKTWKPK